MDLNIKSKVRERDNSESEIIGRLAGFVLLISTRQLQSHIHNPSPASANSFRSTSHEVSDPAES